MTELEHLRAAVHAADDLLELAWGIIANAGGGNWDRETPEWRDAAERWRDRYHEYGHPPVDPTQVLAADLAAVRRIQGAEG